MTTPISEPVSDACATAAVRPLGPQSELEVQRQLGREVDQERFTRLDRALKQEVTEERLIDMRAGAPRKGQPPPPRSAPSQARTDGACNRTATGPLVARRSDGESAARPAPTIGRVIGKGLASDELTGKLHLVVDGVDWRVHYAEMIEAAAGEIKRGSIVEIGRAQIAPRESDRNIAAFARENGGTYEPAVHLEIVRDTMKVPGDNHEGYVLSHVRRLEALRRAGIVQRLDADHWSIPSDSERRALDYDSQRTKQLGVRVLSLLDLDAQVTANAATWLDRELGADGRTPLAIGGFGAETCQAMVQRQRWLIEQELMTQKKNELLYPRNLLGILAQREVDEVGKKLAQERGIAFRVAGDGERITGTYKESVQLVSGHYALIEKSRVHAGPVATCDREGTRPSDRRPGDGQRVSWEFSRKRGLGIGM